MGAAGDCSQSRLTWVLLGLTLLALALRWPLMGRSLWFDEACMSHERIGSWPQLLATLYVDIHPPLYVTTMHFWGACFGDSEVSLRTLPLLCGLASIPLTWWTGRRFVGDRAALWGAALMCLSPVHIWYSAEARLYSPMVMCVLLAVGMQERLLDGPRPRWMWWLLVANVFAMLALHYYLAVYVLMLAALAPWLAHGFTAPARRILAVHGFGLVLLGVFVLLKRSLGQFETSQEYLRDLTLPELGRLVFQWCWTGNTLGVATSVLWWVFQALGVVLLAAGAVNLFRRRPVHAHGPLLLLFALGIPVFLMLASALGLEKTYIERSTLPILPFVFLIAGSGLAAIAHALLRNAAALAVVLLAGASVGALYRFPDDWTVYKPNPDWRSGAAYLGAEIDAGAAGRPLFTPVPNPRTLSYYDARIQDLKSLEPAEKLEGIVRALPSKLGKTLADYAASMLGEFESEQRRLLAGTKLPVYSSGDGTPESLELPARMRDDVLYLLRERWHPPGDRTLDALLASPRFETLETHAFRTLTIYKVRVRP